MRRLGNSMQASPTSIGLVLQHKRRNNCAAGSVYAINSFARRIKRRCDTSAAARLFCSAFERVKPAACRLERAECSRSPFGEALHPFADAHEANGEREHSARSGWHVASQAL